MTNEPRPVLSRGALLMAVAAVALAGCRSQPMITPSPIYSHLSAEQHRQAILRGMTAHRWQWVGEEPGRITARFDRKSVGKYVATVDILYDDQKIWIRYVDSRGLSCQPDDARCETIHRAYNRWIVQLRRDIEYGVQMVRLESQGDRAVGAGPAE